MRNEISKTKKDEVLQYLTDEEYHVVLRRILVRTLKEKISD